MSHDIHTSVPKREESHSSLASSLPLQVVPMKEEPITAPPDGKAPVSHVSCGSAR